MKVLSILGTQRGGSTIVGRLVGALPGFAYGGEMRRLWERGLDASVRCGCGADHVSCPVWSQALPYALADTDKTRARAWQRAAAPDRRSAFALIRLLGGRRSQDTAEYAMLMGRLYQGFGEASDARVVVDGSKQPADAFIAASSGADVYVLHLVRDPRGVAYSLTRRTKNPAGAHAATVVKAAALWNGRNVTAWLVRRAVGRSRFMVLRYEDVMDDTDAALARVAAFVGEDAAAITSRDGKVTLPTAHTPTGDGRFLGEPTAVSEDRSWTTALGGTDRALTNALTAPLRWCFGYS